jgi:excisionase family DNA binding protein
MEQSRTYTINEAAGLTGLHKNTIRQRIRLGQLDATIQQGKFGEEYRIPHEALVEAGLLSGAGPLEEGGSPTVTAEFAPASEVPNGASPVASASLTELFQRHEHAMFRLGYLQGELERVKALAESAESLQRDNEERRLEVNSLRSILDEKETEAAEAARLREELQAARDQLRELDAVRESAERLRALAAEQEQMIQALETRRPWWKLW